MIGSRHTLNIKLWLLSGKKYFVCELMFSFTAYFVSLVLFSDIRDIHDIVEITVFDEDKDHKYEFLGKVLVPLLSHVDAL